MNDNLREIMLNPGIVLKSKENRAGVACRCRARVGESQVLRVPPANADFKGVFGDVRADADVAVRPIDHKARQ